ncbi:MAG: RNA polymerase sigma-70 factor [Tannerella sp.]|jgi:RNA polymerase sigma-70 factor (ECF subfamily)|nr:RNA polymerase sigma-70 factor [Tannerella sp.]
MNYYDELFRKVAMKDDESAFRTLFYQFFTPLCGYAMRYVPNWDDCEDIVQETFLKFWKNRKSLAFNRSFRSFLVASVKNACIDLLRRQDTESTGRERFAHHPADESSEELYALTELEQMLDAALAKLPEPVRAIFVMNRFEGKTYPEIAKAQQVSVKTVEAYMTKALKLLRAELRDFLPALPLFLYMQLFLI